MTGAQGGTGNEEKGGMDVVGIDATLIWQILNFVVLYLVLRRFLYEPVSNFLQSRQEDIAGRYRKAGAEIQKAEELKRSYATRLDGIREEAREIKATARRESEREARGIVRKAGEEADKILERTRVHIQRERREALAGLRDEMVRMTIDCAERLLDDELDERRHHQLIAEAIGELVHEVR